MAGQKKNKRKTQKKKKETRGPENGSLRRGVARGCIY
jgi:hypothetical protein